MHRAMSLQVRRLSMAQLELRRVGPLLAGGYEPGVPTLPTSAARPTLNEMGRCPCRSCGTRRHAWAAPSPPPARAPPSPTTEGARPSTSHPPPHTTTTHTRPSPPPLACDGFQHPCVACLHPAACRARYILTCEYDPPGNSNMPASLPQEVHPPTCAQGATRRSARKGATVAVGSRAARGRAMRRKIL